MSYVYIFSQILVKTTFFHWYGPPHRNEKVAALELQSNFLEPQLLARRKPIVVASSYIAALEPLVLTATGYYSQ